MKTSILIILLVILFFSCKENTNKNASQIIAQDSTVMNDAQDRFKDSVAFRAYINELYSNINEVNIKDYEKDCFRIFLWKFGAPYIRIIRVEKDSLNNIELIAKEVKPSYQYDPKNDTVVNTISLKLSIDQWDKLINLSEESYFWSMEENEWPDLSGTDGSLWFIEGNRVPNYITKPFIPFKTYTAIKRRTPHKGSFYSFGEKIIEYSGLLKSEKLF